MHGRTDKAYRKYGLRAASGTTNLAIYRALARQYPDPDRRQILLDLIESRGDKGKWFAAAKDEGFLDIALECAETHGADPSTLVRAARDFGEAEPRFAATVALMSIRQLLGGRGDRDVGHAAAVGEMADGGVGAEASDQLGVIQSEHDQSPMILVMTSG